MQKEKGQDIIEYALMLAVVVGIGFGIYSYGGQGIANSISSVLIMPVPFWTVHRFLQLLLQRISSSGWAMDGTRVWRIY